MKTLALVAGLAAVCPTRAQAYELDTHFYDTYAMAREAGFKHQYARFLALGAQWVDEGILSTPVGTSGQRRRWHFPTYPFKTKVSVSGRTQRRFVGIASFNHPVAHKLFDEGMRESNWMKISLSIHTIQDSAGHAGFSDRAGHAEFGHDPDRTWQAPEKYKDMTGLVFKMLVALRKVAPGEALEDWALSKRSARVSDQDHRDLQESFWRKWEPIVRRNYFKDPRYAQAAVEAVLREGAKKGFLVESQAFKLAENFPSPKDYRLSEAEKGARAGAKGSLDRTRKDARQVLAEWVIRNRAAEVARGVFVEGSIFNMSALDNDGLKGVRQALAAIEGSKELSLQERIRRYHEVVTPDISRDVIRFTVDDLTRGQIGEAFSDFVKVQFESNGVPREIEKKVKEGDRRALIKKWYGTEVTFGPGFDVFGRRDRVTATLVKSSHNFRSFVRTLLRTDVAAHSDVKSYQSAPVLNGKVETGEYPQLGRLANRSLLGRSRPRPLTDPPRRDPRP